MEFKAILLLCTLAVYVTGEPTGAPEIACEDMSPQHEEVVPQETEPPYTLSAVSEGDGTFLVSITPDEGIFIRGFFTQARRDGDTTPYGIFSLVDDGDSAEIQPRPCPEADGVPNGMTHVINTNKTQVAVRWDPSGEDITGMNIQATVVAQFDIFWVGLTVPLVQED